MIKALKSVIPTLSLTVILAVSGFGLTGCSIENSENNGTFSVLSPSNTIDISDYPIMYTKKESEDSNALLMCKPQDGDAFAIADFSITEANITADKNHIFTVSYDVLRHKSFDSDEWTEISKDVRGNKLGSAFMPAADGSFVAYNNNRDAYLFDMTTLKKEKLGSAIEGIDQFKGSTKFFYVNDKRLMCIDTGNSNPEKIEVAINVTTAYSAGSALVFGNDNSAYYLFPNGEIIPKSKLPKKSHYSGNGFTVSEDGKYIYTVEYRYAVRYTITHDGLQERTILAQNLITDDGSTYEIYSDDVIIRTTPDYVRYAYYNKMYIKLPDDGNFSTWQYVDGSFYYLSSTGNYESGKPILTTLMMYKDGAVTKIAENVDMSLIYHGDYICYYTIDDSEHTTLYRCKDGISEEIDSGYMVKPIY